MGILIVIGIIVLIGIFYIIGTYNGLVALRNQVQNAWKQIDVQLKRRYDLIPNLVEVVKDYMSYEQETLEKVIQARNMAVNAKTMKEQIEADNMVTSTLKSLFAVFENYPDLKANQNVMKLQEELTHTENSIAYARQLYNDLVMSYNMKLQMFPSNIIAGMFNFTPYEYFNIKEEEKENIKVDLR